MRIAFIGQKGIPATYGGVEQHVHDLAISLAQKGHDVTAYSRAWYTKSKAPTHKGVSLVYTPSIHTKHLDAISHTFTSTLHAIFKKYDVIHYHGVGPSLLSWIPRLLSPRTKVITTFHSIDRYHKKWNSIAKFFLRIGEYTACTFAHKTITVSQGLRNYCINEFNKHTAYIPNGVHTEYDTSTGDLISPFGLTRKNYIVMVSRLVPHKGAHLLIEAFHNLKARHADDPYITNLKLAIVGGSAYTDDYVRHLHIQASNVNDIIFTDFQSGDTLREIYRHALALVHPSLNEGLPITVLQAMSHNTPVLVSTIPEHMEIISDPRALFRENDVDSIVQCIYDFINLPREEKEKMIKENMQTLHERYSWDIVVPQIEKVYKQKTKRQQKYTQSLSEL